MTDHEFLQRLECALKDAATWPDIAGVGTSADEPDLFGNALRVYPVTDDDVAVARAYTFRLLCEWEVRPRRAFPPRTLRTHPL